MVPTGRRATRRSPIGSCAIGTTVHELAMTVGRRGARTLQTLLTGIIAAIFLIAPGRADDFYAGKTVNLIVGYSAGGGYDQYARLLAHHLGRYIPGHPAV